MINLVAKVDLLDVDKRIAAMAHASSRFASVFRELRKPMRDDQREHQRQQEGPDGKWQPRAPSTMAAIRKRKRKRLKSILGRIPAALQVKSDAQSVSARPLVHWFSVHHFGGVVGRKSKIPARPFLWISDAFLAKAAREFLEHYAEAWNRGR